MNEVSITYNSNLDIPQNSKKIILYTGTQSTLTNISCIDRKRFTNINCVFPISFLKHINTNKQLYGVSENIIPTSVSFKKIGLYKISYNIAWNLKNNNCNSEYIEANKQGLLAFCNENYNKLIDTSINREKGNTYIVNLKHSFLYDKSSTSESFIQLYIYKLFKPYNDDLVINTTNTFLEIEYLN